MIACPLIVNTLVFCTYYSFTYYFYLRGIKYMSIGIKIEFTRSAKREVRELAAPYCYDL